MMNNPLVSIIMPAYNSEKYITEAINSVIAQTYTNWELLVVDDCSSDNTKNIIESFAKIDNRIKPIYNSKNSTKPSIAKNQAIEKISGELIAFLDSDDIWMNEKLQIQVEQMKSSKYHLCYTGGYYIDKNGNTIETFMPKLDCGYNFKGMLWYYEINNQSVMITKKALDATLKRFNPKLKIGEDYNLFMHIASQFQICSMKELLVKYRLHQDSITKQKGMVPDGVLWTLKELHQLYNIKWKHPFGYFKTYLKAIRFKFIY